MVEAQALRDAQEAVVMLDARTERTLERDGEARGALRMPPDHIADRAAELGLPRDAWLVAFCA
jgi:hypothetical protein